MATDSFNRGAGDVGANWTAQQNSLDVNASNQCKGHTAAAYNQAYWNAESFTNDQFSQGIATGTAGFGGFQVRASGTGASRNGYYVLYGASGSRISKVVNNTITDLVSAGGIADPSPGDVVKIQVVGTTIKVFYNGVQQGSDQTDSSLTSGSPGIIIYDLSAIVDDWEGGNIAASAGGIVFNRMIG